MGAEVEIITGPAGSGKTARCLGAYRDVLRRALGTGVPANVLWIAPTEDVRRQVLRQLPDESLPVAFAPNVMTFARFAEAILRASGTALVSLDPAAGRRLLRRLIDEHLAAGRLQHFAPIAASAGFLDLAQSLIAELKRAEIWPEDFSTVFSPIGARDKHIELALLYRRYQDVLLERGLYDDEGRFWSARDEIAKHGLGPFTNRELVVLDGFSDFTRTQHDILRALAAESGTLLITLPLESPLRRTELFAKTAAVFERMTSELGARHTAMDGTATPARPGVRTVAASLFADSHGVQPVDDAGGIAVLAASGATAEVEVLAGRVKALLLEGVNPADVVVAFRSLDDVADLVRSRFAAAGIPVWCEAGLPLLRSPMLRALFEVVRLELEDWPFERLKSVLLSDYFRPDWGGPDLPARVRRLLRMLRNEKLHSQRRTMLKVLKRYVDRKTADNDDRELTAAFGVLERLSDATKRLRTRTDFAGWVTRLVQLGRELGIAGQLQDAGDLERRDRRVWERFDHVLFAAAHADEFVGGKPARMTLAEFLRACEELLKSQELPPDDDPRGCVRVLEARQVRNLDVGHLFLAGLTERSFPQLRGDDCLYLESERAELREQGLQIGHAAERRQEEMLLFYSLLTRARQSLTLSYASVGPGGAPLFCSPYVTGLLGLFTRNALSPQTCGSLDPVPAHDHVVTPADWRCSAVAELREGRPDAFGTFAERPEFAETASNILAAVDANVARFETTGWTRYEGLIRDAALRKRIREKFPDDHQFSATQLENYAACRFRFFLERILKIEPLDPPTVATDYRRRGSLFHDVLAAVHRDATAEQFDRETLVQRFREHVDERLGRRVDATELAAALTEVERLLFADWSEAYAEQWAEYHRALGEVWSEPPRPAHLELPFGEVPGEEADADMPQLGSLEFGAPQKRTCVRGRIDRVDVGEAEGRTVYNVVDYKTGRPPRFDEDDVRSGKALQLLLYTLAVKRLGVVDDEAQAFQFGYWHIRDSGFVPGLKGNRRPDAALDTAVLQSLEQLLDSLIPWLADGIRGGDFPVDSDDPHCTAYCPYRTVCRITHLAPLRESLQKTRDPGPSVKVDGDG